MRPRNSRRSLIDQVLGVYWTWVLVRDLCMLLTSLISDILTPGTGDWCFRMSEKWPEAHFVGIDVKAVQPDFSRPLLSQFSSQFRFIIADFLEPLPFPDDSFDYVHAKDVFRFVPPPLWDPLLAEVFRVLKTDGILYIGDFHTVYRNPPPALSTVQRTMYKAVGNSQAFDDHMPVTLKFYGRALMQSSRKLGPIVLTKQGITREDMAPLSENDMLWCMSVTKNIVLPLFILLSLRLRAFLAAYPSTLQGFFQTYLRDTSGPRESWETSFEKLYTSMVCLHLPLFI